MDFQERFKGKTSIMSKQGIENLVLSSTKPVKKTLGPSYSTSQLPNLNSSANILEASTKRLKKLPLAMATNGTHHSSLAQDIPSPRTYIPMSGTQLYHFSREPEHIAKPIIYRPSASPKKEKTFFRMQAGPLRQRERPLNRRSLNLKATKSANQSQVAIEPLVSDQSTSHFNPSSFYNQKSHISAPHRILTDMQKNNLVELKLNRNHLHQKSFENLSQLNKQKHVSQDVFRSLHRPDYSQHFNDCSQEIQGSFSQKAYRIFDSNQPSNDRSGSPTPRRAIPSTSGMHIAFETNKNNKHIDYFSNNDMILPIDTRNTGPSQMQNSQLKMLSKLKFQSPNKKDKVNQSGRENSRDKEEFPEIKEVVKLKAVPQDIKGSYINLGNIIAFKSKNQENRTKTKDAWRFAVIEANLKV